MVDLRSPNAVRELDEALNETEAFIGRVEKGLTVPFWLTIATWLFVAAGYLTPTTGLLTSIFLALFRLNLVAILIWNAVKGARFWFFRSLVESRGHEEQVREQQQPERRSQGVSGTGRPRWV